MPFKDNREFITALEKSGDLVCIRREVDWDLEAGAIVRHTNELRGPAILFEKLRDYPPGYRIFGSPLGTHRRLAIALGLKPETTVREIQAEYERRIEHPLKPAVVKKGACQENILQGDEVDLYRFPAPVVHEGDGGRYIGTWHLMIVKDPDSDWVNWGVYRVMVYNHRHLSGHWHPANHMGMLFFSKYLPRRKPMPLAIAIGVDPLCCLAAGMRLEAGESEADYAGALRGKPVELVKCLTSDLMVPASSEIVLEGEIILHEGLFEGPFGEWTGYRTAGEIKPICRVKAITYRRDPILTMVNTGVPLEDNDICGSLTTGVAIKRLLLKKELPVTDVYLPPEMENLVGIVGVKPGSPDIASRVKEIVHTGRVWSPKVILVEGVDVFNLTEVFHALATKWHPVRGLKARPEEKGNPLLPFLTPQERKEGKGATALFDCTWPTEWSKKTEVPPRVSFEEMYPKEMRDKIVSGWKEYGFP